MLTTVLYEQAEGFFKEYEHTAVKGSARRLSEPNAESSELDFLSRPKVWAEDVIAGMADLGGQQRLEAVGQFLAAAGFYGFQVGTLSQAYRAQVAKRYVRVETIFKSNPESAARPQQMLETILQNSDASSMVVAFRTDEGRSSMYVRRKDVVYFWKIACEQLGVSDKKIDVHQVRVMDAWRSFMNGAKASPAAASADEYNKKAQSGERFHPPTEQLDFFHYGLELLGKRLKEERERQREKQATHTSLVIVLHKIYEMKLIESEREKLITSEPARVITDLIRVIPPSRERKGNLQRLTQSLDTYVAMVRQKRNDKSLQAEAQEIVRKWGELALHSSSNSYTQKVTSGIRTLESAIQK